MANEMGYLLSLQKKTKEATRWYSTALDIDTSSVPALAGRWVSVYTFIHTALLLSQCVDVHLLSFFKM